jgi:hypothetical protein
VVEDISFLKMSHRQVTPIQTQGINLLGRPETILEEEDESQLFSKPSTPTARRLLCDALTESPGSYKSSSYVSFPFEPPTVDDSPAYDQPQDREGEETPVNEGQRLADSENVKKLVHVKHSLTNSSRHGRSMAGDEETSMSRSNSAGRFVARLFTSAHGMPVCGCQSMVVVPGSLCGECGTGACS